MTPGESLSDKNAVSVGPEIMSEPKKIPGLFDIISQEGVENDLVQIDNLVPREMMMRFQQESGASMPKAWDDVLLGSLSFREDLQDGFWDIVHRLLEKVTVRHSRVETVDVVFHEIHCPRYKGCVAKYAQDTRNSKNHFFEIKILGFSGGGGESIEIGTGWALSVVEECMYLLKPVEVLVEECDRTYGGPFTRITIQRILGGCKIQLIPQQQDRCIEYNRPGVPQDLLDSVYESPQADPPFEAKSTIMRGEKISHSLSLGLGTVGANLSVTTTALKKSVTEYELAGPQRYYGYQVPGQLGYYWRWEPLSS